MMFAQTAQNSSRAVVENLSFFIGVQKVLLKLFTSYGNLCLETYESFLIRIILINLKVSHHVKSKTLFWILVRNYFEVNIRIPH